MKPGGYQSWHGLVLEYRLKSQGAVVRAKQQVRYQFRHRMILSPWAKGCDASLS